MATYIIGDIHGRFETLEALLSQLPWRPRRDHLWLTGDLVNRGPRSLDVLRWAAATGRDLGERFVAVLGNHDLHLLSLHLGLRKTSSRHADLLPILQAQDGPRLVDWLLHRPLLHRRDDVLLVHAGLLPSWTAKKAQRRARQAEELLRRPETASRLLGPRPDADDPLLRPWKTVEALTRLRTLDADGASCSHSGPPDQAPAGCIPWFDVAHRRSRDADIVFGHWAALGLYQAPGITCLDSGCAWAGHLSALRLEDRKLFQQKALEPSA